MATLDGLHPTLMRPRVESLLRDPDAVAHGVTVVSGFRSIERQRELYAAAEERCRHDRAKCPPSRWVAPPGHSNHGPRSAAELQSEGYIAAEVNGQGGGIAVDFGIRGVQATSAGQWPQQVSDWFQALAARHGLYQRMPWEDWHFEPIKGWHAPAEERDMTDEERKHFDAQFDLIRDDVAALKKKVESVYNLVNIDSGKIANLVKQLDK